MHPPTLPKGRIDYAANVAILIAVVVFLAFVGQQEYDRHHLPFLVSKEPLVGRTISLPGVHFTPHSKTLLLAISTTCHFCKDSEPFYRKLASQSQSKVGLLAVLPQSQAEAQGYVQKFIGPSVQVASSGLDSIGVSGTPTVLLVDGNGKVQQAWAGKLSDQGEKQVQALLM